MIVELAKKAVVTAQITNDRTVTKVQISEVVRQAYLPIGHLFR
jgi:hypothetical protein